MKKSKDLLDLTEELDAINEADLIESEPEDLDLTEELDVISAADLIEESKDLDLGSLLD